MINEKVQRIGKILGIYALALVAAVACGEGFKPMNHSNMSRNGVMPLGTAGSISTMSGTISATDQVSVSFIDGSIAVPNISINLSNGESYGSANISGTNYRVSAVRACPDECSAIAFLIERSGGAGYAKTAAMMSSQGTTLSLFSMIPSATFSSASDAIPSLLAKGNGGGI